MAYTSTSITKNILDWTEEKFDEIDVVEDKHPFLKAFGLGAIQGAIDGAVFMYIPVLIGCYIWKHKALKK